MSDNWRRQLPPGGTKSTAPTRRVNRGRGHSYYLDGETVPGVTTILGKGFPKPALIGWAANITAGYAHDHWDELTELKPSERLHKLERARWDELGEASERGTDVHLLAHRLAAGEDVDVPETLTGHVDSYLKFVEDWQPKELLVEAVVANRRWRYMGTIDAIAQLADGRVWLLDFKTSRSGIFLDHGLQLCAYSRAEFYIDPNGTEQPLPTVDRAGCVWLRADGYDLIPVDITDDSFRIFLYVQELAAYIGEATVGEAITPPAMEAAT